MSSERFRRQVEIFKERVRGMVARAELPEGARVDEVQLRLETGITVRAARCALQELAGEGLINRKRHVGTFVSGRLQAATFPVLPKVCSVGILSSRGQSFFSEPGYGKQIMSGVQLSLHTPAQVTFFVHTHNRQLSIDDLPITDPDTIKRTCQGVLAVEAYNAADLNELTRSGVPVVAVDFSMPQMGFDAVEVDHFSAGYLAAQHLISLGHRRIAFVGEGPLPESMDPTWQIRLNGFMRAMVEAGLNVSTANIVHIARSAELISKALPPVQKKYQPTGYVLCSASHYRITLETLTALGLKVPEDVSISAADHAPAGSEDELISHVRVDYEFLGRNAIRILASRLACKAMPPIKQVLPVNFSPGPSSCPVR